MTDRDTLLPRFQRTIVMHEPHESVRSALREMLQRDYSQALVRVRGRLSLLTLEGLGKIMAAGWNDDYVDIKHSGVEDMLQYEPEGTMVVMTGDRTVSEAKDVLMRLTTPRVHAIVITDTGDDRGEPLGIVTPDDIAHLGQDS